MTPTAEALLVSAARSQHVAHLIKPALAAGSWVLCDRFADSTRVYQGAVGGVGRSDLEGVIALSTGGLSPDLTFVLDGRVEITLPRVQRRSQQDSALDSVIRYDQAAVTVHERIRQAFLQLRQEAPQRLLLIDAERSPAAMLEQAVAALEARFGG